MEVPIQVAVRVFPCYANELCRVEIIPKYIDDNEKQLDVLSNGCQPNIDNESCGVVQVLRCVDTEDNNGNSLENEKIPFKFRHALPYGCTQDYLYRTTVQPMIRNFIEGFDVSIVTYGQCCTGKTYCMYGPGFDGAYSELEQGIVPRAICDIFTQLTKRPSGCRFSVKVAWIELRGDEVHDILGGGIIQCQSLNDVFQCLRIGFGNRSPIACHSIFTITIEQQWVSPDGLLQHRVSTASFCDLLGTQRVVDVNEFDEPITLSKDNGLQALERVVSSLCDPAMLENGREALMQQYEEAMLTRLLKDSFGGRAQTLLICCVSPLEQDAPETIDNLHFAYKTQFVRNAVVLNTFSDNNMHITNFIDPVVMPDVHVAQITQYNATYMNKMNAENNQTAPSMDFANSQWLKLISNAEGLFSKLLSNNKALNDDDRECIEEWMYLKQECESFGSGGLSNPRLLKPIQETDETSDNEQGSNTEAMEQEKTDASAQNATYSDNESDTDENLEQLEAKVCDLSMSFSYKVNELVDDNYVEYNRQFPKAVTHSIDDKDKNALACVKVERTEGVTSHRRRSVQGGDSSALSRSDLDHLKRIAEEGMKNSQQVNLNNTVCREATAFLENSDDMHPLRMANRHKSEDVLLNAIRRLQIDIKTKETERMNLKQNIKLIDELVESPSERVKAKRDLGQNISDLKKEREKYKRMIGNSRDRKKVDELRLHLEGIEGQLIEKTRLQKISDDSENKMHQHRQESKKRLTGLKNSLKADRKALRDMEGKLKIEKTRNAKEEKRSPTCINVDTRITQLDYVLKEKNEYLHKNHDESDMVESIRHEIRNLRSQRDRLTDAQCLLKQKLKQERPNGWEARQILEYEVAKDVIDHAMEMKNQLICGRDVTNRNFAGNPDLMGQLSKLNEKEMRVLLYKCFQKIVDLRESSRLLEIQLLHFEQERNEWELRERAMYEKFQQSRLQEERYTLGLQKQYQSALTKLLQKAGEDCGPTADISGDSMLLPPPMQLIHSNHRHHHTISNRMNFGIHDFDDGNRPHSYRFPNTALAANSKRDNNEPIDKLKQNYRMSLLNKFFGQNHGLKRNIPQQLMLTNHTQPTEKSEGKVTVSKNKIIIQQK